MGISIDYKNEKHESNCKRWEYVGNLTDEDYIQLGCKVKRNRAWYKCRLCGELKAIYKSNFKTRTTVCENGCHGVGARTGFVIKGVNDVATTHPLHIKYFANEEEANIYSYCSKQKVLLRCPLCNFEKKTAVYNLTSIGFCCPVCSDGVSYPEKFVSNLLNQFGINYVRQFSFGGRIRYDFYVEDIGLIIETHGKQHYEECTRGRSLEEEQENDKYKKEIALKNGIDTYIELDCRFSECKWIKDSIMNSELPGIFNFTEKDVDWISIEKSCQNSLVKEVCEYFSNNDTTAYEMTKIFNLSNVTISNYLKRGNKLGWCIYDTKEEMKKRGEKSGKTKGKAVRGIHKETGEVVEFSSVKEATQWLRSSGIGGNVGKCCNGGSKSAGGYIWSHI